ncbi:hypothetical protein [Rhizobium herbae]|uniref:Nif11-like leader peptide family natural product n=1 Tax=Rhizobium herbae TaxID=508661 RepID=A0ABS4EN62_9HYPH|nr:hypothetical protein [Rhizobium herbae]MBP1859370.1 hypothetical protein [Rhizobium herbae]
MSKEKAIEFLERLENDEDFRKAVIDARNKLFGAGQTGTPTPDIIAELGFNSQDMHEAMYARGSNLSTDQIRSITGGAEKMPIDKLETIALMHIYGVTQAEAPPES